MSFGRRMFVSRTTPVPNKPDYSITIVSSCQTRQLSPFIKGVSFFKFWEKEFYCFKNWILQWKVTSGMDGRGVEWRIKGVLFFKKWLALYRCIVKYRWSVMIWTVYYPICGTKDYIRYDEAVLLNQTEFLFSDCAINFDKRSFVF